MFSPQVLCRSLNDLGFPLYGFIFSIVLCTTALHMKENRKGSAGCQCYELAEHSGEQGSGKHLTLVCLT